MTYGWIGKYAEIDLSTGTVLVKKLPEHYMKEYIGSRGINSKFLSDLLDKSVDPLGPENLLIFGVGPLTGTLAPASGRWTVTAKSPMTGLLGDANAGGHWGAELKFAGFDHLIIKGQAQHPVYLWISDGEIEIKDAAHLWGKNTWQTTDLLKNELGDEEVKVACIGPAGENLVKFACVISDRTRAAGRCGIGAVMGSKNLKAIAVRGRLSVQVADPENFVKSALKIHRTLRYEWPAYEGMGTQGSLGLVTPGLAMGWLPVKYYNSNEAPYEQISPEKFIKDFKVQSLGCFGCPVHCGHFYEIKGGKFRGQKGEGPEYETFVAVGPKCGIFEMDAILHMTNLINQYGLDSIDTGNAIAILMELKDKGYINEEDIGMDLSWGNVDTAIELINKIVKREGIGDILAEGSFIAVQKLNKEAIKLVWQIKGVGNIGVDLRTLKGANLGYSTSTRGLDHLRGICCPEEVALDPEASKALFDGLEIGNPDSYEQKPEGNVWMQKFVATVGASGICLFNTAWICAPLGPKELAELMTYATGITYTEEDVFTAGERIFNLERVFINELGITREDDYPPAMVFEEPVKNGPRKGAIIDREKFNQMLDRYYELMGWDVATGVPKEETLKRLNLK